MSLCVFCGIRLAETAALCAHHHVGASDEDWASANRMMCDLLHRGFRADEESAPPAVETVPTTV
jgi:hypothetical protein